MSERSFTRLYTPVAPRGGALRNRIVLDALAADMAGCRRRGMSAPAP